MPSPRTEPERGWSDRLGWPSGGARGLTALPKQLNVRFVLALAVVALIALVTSGVAISQILPGYFLEQTVARMRTAAAATGTELRTRMTEMATEVNVLVPEIRDTSVVPSAAIFGARIYPATVTITDGDGTRVARAVPQESEASAEQGLRRDRLVPSVSQAVIVDLPDGSTTLYTVTISDPFTNREATLAQIQSALVGAGALALAVSLVLGIVAARSLSVPIGRLRRVSGRIAQGQLDERVAPSGVLEVDELGQQFNVMADRLAGTLRMLEADRDRLREFVADVSHELRTPIAALRMYTELQQEDDTDGPTRREFLQRSLEQIGRLEWLSTNLLDLSRIDAGIFPLDMREGDLRDPIQAVVQATSEVAIGRNVSLDSSVPSHPVVLRFDRERVIQLLSNLVGNALKFTPGGGAVEVDLAERPGEVIVEVRDTGPGIPPEELPRIFDRFYRGTNTGDARASGSGLGLAIVRSIVEMHGGEIEVASVVGEGTRFRISLPRTAESAPDVTDEKVNETSRSHRPARNPGPIA